VDELSLAVSSEGLGIGGEAGGVPSVVTGELTSEVSGGVVGVRAKVLGAVGAVPLDSASRNRARSLEKGKEEGEKGEDSTNNGSKSEGQISGAEIDAIR
jgi:hypothetical protein